MKIFCESIGQEIKLDKPSFVGGEGELYKFHDRPDKLGMKIWKNATSESAAKLDVQLHDPPPASIAGGQVTVAWPLSRILSHRNGDVLGYEMDYAVGKRPIIDIYTPSRRHLYPCLPSSGTGCS